MNEHPVEDRSGSADPDTAARVTWIDPEFVRRARMQILESGRPPLLEHRLNAYSVILHAEDRFGMGSFELIDPEVEENPQDITWREYAERAAVPLADLISDWNLRPDQLDESIDDDALVDLWPLEETPSGAAYEVVRQFDLAPRFVTNEGSLGEIDCLDGNGVGNDYLGIQVPDLLLLSCLQYALDRLNSGVKIILIEDD